MRRLPLITALGAMLLVFGVLSGCGDDPKTASADDQKGTFEDIGESMDNTKESAEETAKSAEETADKIDEAVDDAGDGNE